MAKEYTVKVSGRKTKYRKIGSEYYRIKRDGELAKDPATGLVLANLKNAAGSRLVSSPDKMLATIRSAVSGTNKKDQMGRSTNKAMASAIKDDSVKSKLNLIRDMNKSRVLKDGGKAALQKFKEREKQALNIIENDTNIKTNDYKPLKDVDKKKELKTLKEYELRNAKVNKTKSLQNTTTEKETNKEKETPKKSKSFLDRVTEDFSKAVKETKRNIQGDIKTGTGRYKSVNEKNLDSNGNYKGTNIKPTKLQLSRMSAGGMTKKKKKK